MDLLKTRIKGENMKRKLKIIILFALILSLMACGKTVTKDEVQETEQEMFI